MTARRRSSAVKAPAPVPVRPRVNGTTAADQRPRKTAEFVAQRIVGHIIDSDQRTGAMLPPERTMLEEYKVGRGSLREALRFLELQGVLKMKAGPGGGPSVDQPTSRPLANTLALLLAMDRTPFSAILEVRETLEPTLAARAAEVDDDENLAEIEESVEAMDEHASDHRLVSLHNQRFHDLIAIRAGNPVFAHLVIALNWIIDGAPLGVHVPPAQVHAAARAHQRIFDALCERDADAAYEAMRQHLAEFTTYLSRHYKETLHQPVRWENMTY